MAETPRVRFAPSPTGALHMGGVRTALFNYLFARKHGGVFYLRIEDTDQQRYVEGAEAYIREALEWAGIAPDESPWNEGNFGPYRQSERKHLYRAFADQLIEAGHAYYAFDTPEELEAMRERLKNARVPNPQYNATVRGMMKNALTLPADEVAARIAGGEPYTIRAKMPRQEELRFHDLIRGWVQVNTATLDDKVLFKSDGMPTYHLANIVDDHLMKTTHVIRGEEWLPSAPLHVLLYRFFGWDDSAPQFAHLPLILRPDGNGKLSKRDGDRLGFPVFPLAWTDPETGEKSLGYRERGYLPEAFVNMLALLGWNPGGDQELFAMDELIDRFSLERVGKSGSRFDADKARWFNQMYLRQLSNTEVAKQISPLVAQRGVTVDAGQLEKFVALVKDRVFFLADFAEELYIFQQPTDYPSDVLDKKWTTASEAQITAVIEALSSWGNAAELQEKFNALLHEKGWPAAQVLPLLRIFLTGRLNGPAVFDLADFLGRQEFVQRLQAGISTCRGRG